MVNNILSLSKQFISVKSYAGNWEALDAVLQVAATTLKGFTIERFENKRSKSILVYSSQKRPSKFRIVLNGHLDIIPGKDYQYVPKVINNRLYGVGAMDMKASAACLILVFKEMAKKVNYPLGLQLVTDEEIGGFNGTKYQIDKGVRADFVIVGESTSLNINNSSKGVLWLKISTYGKTAHSAYPWRGENAIWKMNNFLSQLRKKFPNPSQEGWETTVNLSKIETNNQTFNKIPDDCEIWLDIRYVPKDSNKIANNIKKIVPPGYKTDIIEYELPLLVKENNQFIRLLQKIAKKITNKPVSLYGSHGSSDARHFSRVSCDSVCFGPIGGGIGSDVEWVDISSLEQNYKILKEFLLKVY